MDKPVSGQIECPERMLKQSLSVIFLRLSSNLFVLPTEVFPAEQPPSGARYREEYAICSHHSRFHGVRFGGGLVCTGAFSSSFDRHSHNHQWKHSHDQDGFWRNF